MRWSSSAPFAVDLRSSRATPAPPAMMVAYSSRLALCTTVTGLLFSGRWRRPPTGGSRRCSRCRSWAGRGLRLLRSAATWADPPQRARVVTTVAVA